MSVERADLRLSIARAFEEGATAVAGSGSYRTQDQAGPLLVPATWRIVGMGAFPWFIVEAKADHNQQTLMSERIFSLDGVLEEIAALGDLPVLWTAER